LQKRLGVYRENVLLKIAVSARIEQLRELLRAKPKEDSTVEFIEPLFDGLIGQPQVRQIEWPLITNYDLTEHGVMYFSRLWPAVLKQASRFLLRQPCAFYYGVCAQQTVFPNPRPTTSLCHMK
jgi:hypothetical protein